MRKLSLALVALLVTLGVANAGPPESSHSVFIVWKLSFIDNNNERHEYAVSRDGGPVKVDTGDWKCVYEPITSSERGGFYTESSVVNCRTAKYGASTTVTCGPKSAGGWQKGSLTITANGRANAIVMECEPRD